MAQSYFKNPELESLKTRFTSTLRDFINDMATTYPNNPQLERNRNRLTIAAENARDNVVFITGRFFIAHLDTITNYQEQLHECDQMTDPVAKKARETELLVVLFQSRLFICDAANIEVIADNRVAKHVMELFEAMKEDLLLNDFNVIDDNTETKMSIRRKAADYIVTLTMQFIEIGEMQGGVFGSDSDDDEDDE